jgi:hypothetical protein
MKKLLLYPLTLKELIILRIKKKKMLLCGADYNKKIKITQIKIIQKLNL